MRKEVTTLKQQVKNLKLKTDGPKQLDSYTLMVDLGYIKGCPGENPEKFLTVMLNPTQLKTPTSEGTATPLTIKASQFQQWTLRSATLVATAVVGSSAVAGSTYLLTVLQDAGQTGEVNVDTLYTRDHVQLTLGKSKIWKLNMRMLQGPLAGWFTMTADREQTVALGPRIEAWGYGKTTSTYQDKPWTGSLWRLQIKVTYGFTSYAPQPNLANLIHEQHPGNRVQIDTDADGQAVMSLEAPEYDANGTLLGYNPNGPLVGNSGSTPIGDIIWAISDVAIDAASAAFPGWGWLIKGAWWFVRKIAGKDLKKWLEDNPVLAQQNKVEVYYVYRSLDDARRDQVWCPPLGSPKTIRWNADVTWQQITAATVPLQAQVTTWPVALEQTMATVDIGKMRHDTGIEEPAMFVCSSVPPQYNGGLCQMTPIGSTTPYSWTKWLYMPIAVTGSIEQTLSPGCLIYRVLGTPYYENTWQPKVLCDGSALLAHLKQQMQTQVYDPGVTPVTMDFNTGTTCPAAGYMTNIPLVYTSNGVTSVVWHKAFIAAVTYFIWPFGDWRWQYTDYTLNAFIEAKIAWNQSSINEQFSGRGQQFTITAWPGTTMQSIRRTPKAFRPTLPTIQELEENLDSDESGVEQGAVGCDEIGPGDGTDFEEDIIQKHVRRAGGSLGYCFLCTRKVKHDLDMCVFNRETGLRTDLTVLPSFRNQVEEHPGRQEDWYSEILSMISNCNLVE